MILVLILGKAAIVVVGRSSLTAIEILLLYNFLSILIDGVLFEAKITKECEENARNGIEKKMSYFFLIFRNASNYRWAIFELDFILIIDPPLSSSLPLLSKSLNWKNISNIQCLFRFYFTNLSSFCCGIFFQMNSNFRSHLSQFDFIILFFSKPD